MQRISTSSAVADLFGSGKSGFRNGDLPRGVLPTAFNAEWCNHVQEEICNVIEGAGVALNPDKRDQLLTALQKLIDNSTVKTSGNQEIGGEKTFTSTAFFKGGAFVADSVADFAANQYLQIGANNVNTYLHNKRSGKYLSMRNDGELRYDGKRLLDASDLLGMVPSGAVLYFSGRTAPAGWLKANGAAVSRTAYAALFAAIGTTYGAGDGRSTFNLPDLRGEFLRGWDDGRGVDTGRVFGSAQAHALQSHQHGLAMAADGAGDDLWFEQVPKSAFEIPKGKTAVAIRDTRNLIDTTTDVPGRSAAFNVPNMATQPNLTQAEYVSGETRPRNVALLAIIKI